MFDVNKARLNLQERFDARKKLNRQVWLEARNDSERIIRMLIDHYRPKRVVQWGSLLDSGAFDENSDIDIAVEGILAPEIFFELLGAAMNMTSFKLDIVQLEKVEKEFAELILEKGVVVYEESDQNPQI